MNLIKIQCQSLEKGSNIYKDSISINIWPTENWNQSHTRIHAYKREFGRNSINIYLYI